MARVPIAAAASSAPAPRRAPVRVRNPRHLTLVDAVARRRARRVRIAVWGFGFVTALCVFVAVAFHVALAQSQFRLDRLSRDTAAAQLRYEEARLQVSQLAAPGRIKARAAALGMEDGGTPTTVVGLPGVEDPSQQSDTSGAPGGDWEKVKPHLAAQP